jgi:hypothetical protein
MFEVTSYQYPYIFVTSRRTAETYKLSVRNDSTLALDGASADEREARRTAVAYLARISRPHAA